MDIDVKNAYICATKVTGPEFEDILFEDIYRFICYISIDGADERFDTFRKIYIQKDYDMSSVKLSDNIPSIMVLLRDKNPENAKIIASFFTILGRYYLLNRYDKKFIDKDKFVDYMKLINESLPQQMIKEKISEPVLKGNTNQSYKTVEITKEIDEEDNTNIEETESLEELLNELQSLIGLDGVKNEVNQIINLIRLQKKGEEFGEKSSPLSLHLVFYGNPGTGKTTVARLIAKIYRALGVLTGGQLIEVDRGGLVGGYVGQTAIKTQEVIDKAMGGILFVDEAYSLTHGKGENDFGQEAVDTILKAMEDHRDDFIVIVAGYPELMKEFIASNPGLKSRFNQYIEFEDYTPEQLRQIFMLDCSNQNLILGDGCEDYLLGYFKTLYDNRSDDYANGRDVRNYFEKVAKMRANRLSPILETITRDEYLTINISDLKAAAECNNEWI